MFLIYLFVYLILKQIQYTGHLFIQTYFESPYGGLNEEDLHHPVSMFIAKPLIANSVI